MKNKKKWIVFLGSIVLLSIIACQDKRHKNGEKLYQVYCSNCHLDDGKGLGLLIPPIESSSYLKENPNKIACIIRYGIEDTILVNGKQYSEKMEGIPQLKNTEIINIVNYINSQWPFRAEDFKLSEIENLLENCPK